MDRSLADVPMQVYGSKISYYTGKLEAYLRFRSIPYEVIRLAGHERMLIAGAGASQMPVVRLGDGRWMTDTKPMLAWLDRQHTAAGIFPTDPALNFLALLIEDYTDEWLWRSAMHYRWSYRPDRRYACEALHNEQIAGYLALPAWVGRALLIRRQRGGFVRGDGINRHTRGHAEQGYLAALDALQTIFGARPFILGDSPTIADFGMMGPMFRHFGQDPTPSEIMRERAPAVFEWVARMWNAKGSDAAPVLVDKSDPALQRLLGEICETHLEQLRQNAEAFTRGLSRYDQTIQGARYVRVPCSRYRVWCLEILRRKWSALAACDQIGLRAILAFPEARVLWEELDIAPSGYDVQGQAPFNRAINVFANGVPL